VSGCGVRVRVRVGVRVRVRVSGVEVGSCTHRLVGTCRKEEIGELF